MSAANYKYAEAVAPAGAPLLVLLHGTGGDGESMIGLGRELLPGAHLIAPDGDVLEGGARRFFRRLAEGVFDMADLARATDRLAAFLVAEKARAGASQVLALGYSNGANVLASVLFAAPGAVDRAVLMHPLIPFAPPAQPGLAGKRLLLTAGRYDPICPPAQSEELLGYFRAQGAEVDLLWHEGGHEVRRTELAAAAAFLARG